MMNLNLSSKNIVIYIFMVCLIICYLLARLINSGPIKISEHGTKQYIATIVLMIITSMIFTAIIASEFNIIDSREIFSILKF